MYETVVEPCARSPCAAPRAGPYSAELRADLDCDLTGADAELTALGYVVIDADQWGWSYRHRHDGRRTAQLDEGADPAGPVRLRLRYDGPDEAWMYDARAELIRTLDATGLAAAAATDPPEWKEALSERLTLGDRAAFGPPYVPMINDLDGDVPGEPYYRRRGRGADRS